MPVTGKVLDYVKELDGIEIKGQYPFTKQFDYEFPDLNNGEQCKRIFTKLFKVKKGYKQVNFEGDFLEGGAVVVPSFDDLPDEIKELIEDGIYTKDDALAACATSGNRTQKMILRKPSIRVVGEEKTPVLQVFEERYSEDDLTFEFDKDDDVSNEGTVTESTDVDGMDWLNNL